MELVLALFAAAFIAGVTAAALEYVAGCLHRRQQRLAMVGAQPCTLLFSSRIPCRDPNVVKVGAYMLACAQWSPLLDTCKANGSGSPND